MSNERERSGEKKVCFDPSLSDTQAQALREARRFLECGKTDLARRELRAHFCADQVGFIVSLLQRRS